MSELINFRYNSDSGLTLDEALVLLNQRLDYFDDFENGSYHPNEKTVIECNDKMIN